MKFFEDPYKHLKMDEETKKFLESKGANQRKKKWVFLAVLLIILAAVGVLKCLNWITPEFFQFVVSAFLGGFIGTTLSYLINNK